MTEAEEKKQEETEQNADGKSEEAVSLEVSATEEKTDNSIDIASDVASGSAAAEEESVQDICSRYLNIFRQLHVLSEASIAKYNDEVKDASEDVIFDLYNLPGGLELVDHITFLRTGEKVNSRRLRARQKQEEEMGIAAPKKDAKKEETPAPQPVVQQPVIQYVPMPTPTADGNSSGGAEAMASMQAMMAQFVSMQQTANTAPSFSASELASALLSGQKELMAHQTKNYLEGQKSIISMQTKAFVDGQRTLVEMQKELSRAAEEKLLSMQEKLLNEAREAIDKNQKILFAMQKSMLDEMTAKIEEVVGKVAESMKFSVDYGALKGSFDGLASGINEVATAVGNRGNDNSVLSDLKTTMDSFKDSQQKNIEAINRVADSIKNLQIVSGVPSSDIRTSDDVVSSDAVDSESSSPKGESRKVETVRAGAKLKESDYFTPDEDAFIRMGREKRRERFKKHHVNSLNTENTIAVTHDDSPKDSVFVNPKSEEVVASEVDDADKNVGNAQVDVSTVSDSNDENGAISEIVGDAKNEVVSEASNESVATEEDKVKPSEEMHPISDTVGIQNDETSPSSNFVPDNIIQPTAGQNEPPLAEENVPSSISSGVSDVAASIYNRPKVEDIKPNSEAFIPVQGSIDNLPPPGVMSESQLTRTEKNIGFAINEGSYKGGAEGGYKEEPHQEKKTYDEDPFAKKISPKSISRFKSKKSSGTQGKEAKKGIFSVFKNLVKDDDSSNM